MRHRLDTAIVPTLAELRLFAQYHLLRRVHDHPARDTELGVVSLGYEPLAFEAQIRALGGRFDVREQARVSYQGRERPIFSITSRPATPTKTLLILSGVHGNEQAGIVCVPELLERFEKERARWPNLTLVILTPVNAVGAAELSRFNADGYDINRDFVRFTTKEAQLVREVMDETKPDFVVSLHEGPQDATFMFANEHVDPALARRLLSAIEAGGTALAKNDYFGSTLRPPGLSPSTAFTRALLRLWAGTLGMMASSAYCGRRGVPELTLESSWRSADRASRVRGHVDLCIALAAELA